MRLVLLATLLLTSCASTITALGIGFERGKANVVVAESSLVYLERKPREPADVVVLLHGFGGNKDHWTRFIAQMPSELWIIAPDLPGFGENQGDPALSYDLQSQAARLAQFLKAHGVDRFHLVGNSMGGELAVVYALAHPEQVRSLVLFDPSGLRGPVPSAMDKRGAPLVIHNAADFDEMMKLSMHKQPDIPDFVKSYFVEQALAHAAFDQKISADIDAKRKPIDDDIARLEPPTLVVWGEDDQVIDPSAVPLWRARLPLHDVVVMTDTGHAPMIERPGESAALVLKWWQRAGALEGTARPPAP